MISITINIIQISPIRYNSFTHKLSISKYFIIIVAAVTLFYVFLVSSKAVLALCLIFFLAYLNSTEVCHETSLSILKIMKVLKCNYHQKQVNSFQIQLK